MELNNAILSTLSYHSKFNYPLTLDELHRFLLINRPLSSNEVKSELIDLTKQKKIVKKNNFYYLPNFPNFPNFPKSPNLPNIRLKRRESSLPKLRLAARAARLIGFLPWIKLVCVTGSLAMENSDPDDDIDLMIVTSQNRLWLARPLVVLLVSLFFNRRTPHPHPHSSTHNPQPTTHNNEICLNLWLDEDVLAMPKHRRTSTTAHELAQMKPLVNKNHTYEKMLSLNKWGAKFLANFWTGVSLASEEESPWRTPRRLLIIFNDFLNSFLFRLQLRYMSRRRTTEEVTPHSAFFHPDLEVRNTR